MPFLSPLKMQLLNDRSQFPWLTLEKLVYESALTGGIYEVPRYFRTDGASVPKALISLPGVGPALFMRFFGKGVWQGFREGVLHDFLRRKRDGVRPVPASVAHLVFREALTEAGYPPELIAMYYRAVKIFNSFDEVELDAD